MNAALDRANEVIVSEATEKCSGRCSEPEPSSDDSPISVPIRFTFNTPGVYSRCVKDILQLYQDRRELQKNGRTSDCLPEVFQTYTEKGLSRNQAFELIQAANAYATTTFSSKLFPPKGQRLRIQQLFGFAYTIVRLV
ncbi:hypothetical protein JOY44_21090 [Phormidium sp. CLA17]|uniref:hypothetical protein n=1 Tax=Leptolyngbya sp. Cla-17 TaxID=2803751 RepID=UPI00149293F3|nr:hypothetical protein [Leptolyngbya sp. Cla-17]MBM0744084.1 hypothetical protein [Leptolyngbya sp. Cla-17]